MNKRPTIENRDRSERGKPVISRFIIFGVVTFGVLATLWYFAATGGSERIDRFFSTVNQFIRNEPEQPEHIEICVDEAVSSEVLSAVTEWTEEHEDSETQEWSLTTYSDGAPERCSAVVSSQDEDNFDLVSEQYFVLVGSVKTAHAVQTLSEDEVLSLIAEGTMFVGGTDYSVVIDQDSVDALDRAVGVGVSVEARADVVGSVIENHQLLGVVPFEKMSSSVGEISISGSSFRGGTISSGYLLADRIWIDSGDFPDLFDSLQEQFGGEVYDPGLVKSVVVTGTSVVGARGWFATSTANGDWMYPLRNVADILREASIAHISNEGSRVDGCQQYPSTLVFCGPPAAYDALTWAGVDVVGLTGNHILDYGRNWFNSTLDWYDSQGIQYFGGGRDLTAAHRAALFDLGTVRLAFLGYNMIPPSDYYATPNGSGSAQLGETALRADIAAAKENADFVFVDMQWGNEYVREPNSYQTTYGRIAVESGATVVSGVHPHWIQPVEHYGEGFIFYSLGNFLFDQTWSQETREGVMVKHYFYGKKYLGFEIIPTRIDDEKQVDLAEGEARDRIVGEVLNGM